jgi:hypothetical protein
LWPILLGPESGCTALAIWRDGVQTGN